MTPGGADEKLGAHGPAGVPTPSPTAAAHEACRGNLVGPGSTPTRRPTAAGTSTESRCNVNERLRTFSARSSDGCRGSRGARVRDQPRRALLLDQPLVFLMIRRPP